MPKRPRSHQLETFSLDRLRAVFNRQGWTVEDLQHDYGEDLLVRIFDKGRATPLAFFVQAKATDNIRRYFKPGGTHLLFPITTDHAHHWSRFWEPIFLTVWDSKADVTYWTCIQDALSESSHQTNAKTTRLRIPVENVVDDHGCRRIRAKTRARFSRFEREQAGAEVLLDILKQELGLELEYSSQDGILIFPKGRFVRSPNGDMGFVAFGKTAELFDRLHEKYGFSPKEVFHSSIDLMKQRVDAFKWGSHLELRDPTGAVVTRWTSLQEFIQHIKREQEGDESEDE
jgi:hypothetical protein